MSPDRKRRILAALDDLQHNAAHRGDACVEAARALAEAACLGAPAEEVARREAALRAAETREDVEQEREHMLEDADAETRACLVRLCDVGPFALGPIPSVGDPARMPWLLMRDAHLTLVSNGLAWIPTKKASPPEASREGEETFTFAATDDGRRACALLHADGWAAVAAQLHDAIGRAHDAGDEPLALALTEEWRRAGDRARETEEAQGTP